MPTEFESYLADGTAALFDQMGEPAQYLAAGAGQIRAVPITVIAGAESQLVVDGNNAAGRILQRSRTFMVYTAAVPTPQRLDVITYNGEDWGFDSVHAKQAGVSELLCARHEVINVTQGGYIGV